jgi:hypothetical protein
LEHFISSRRGKRNRSPKRGRSLTRNIARSFENDAALSSSVQNRDASLPGQLTTSSARNIRETPDAHSEVMGRSFADQRTFREQGKSQKSLDRQNPPLTIGQVRELLNKNK